MPTKEKYEKQRLANAICASEAKEPETRTDADNLPQSLIPIIFGHLDNNIHNTPSLYAINRTLFGNLSQLYDAEARLAAMRLLQGDTVTTEKLVEKNPAILYSVVEVTDRRGNKVKGTLLQIAALLGDCNIQEQQIPEKDYGMVERLKAYLPIDEAIKQLLATRPAGWEQETAARMQSYVDAVTEFMNDIINTQQVPDSDYTKLETTCAAHITKFRSTLATIPSQQPVIRTGLLFDPQIFVKVIDNCLAKMKDSIKDLHRHKEDLFAIVGFGGLQTCASACDLQAMKKGLYYVMDRKQEPDRSLNFAAGVPQSLVGLGDSDLVDIWGDSQFSPAVGVRVTREHLQDYVKAKTVSLQCAMQQPDNHAKSRGVIL